MRILDLSHRVTGNAIAHAWPTIPLDNLNRTARHRLCPRNWEMRDLSASRKVCAGIKIVTLNLHTARGRAILLDLATTAEAIAVNFIPSMLEEQRTGPAEMHARQPNLVIRQVSGRGQTGIYRHKPNFGSPIEAISPFATNNGYGNRLQMLPPHALIDNIIGLYGAFTLKMATRFREVSATHCTKPVCDAEDDLYAALLASIQATAERLFHAIGNQS